MRPQSRSPSELRNMFGRNLRILAAEYQSITDLSRRLGINRTQLNRYLAGESFPRPDVLARICAFFSVDARILLEPVESIGPARTPEASDYLRAFMGPEAHDVSEDIFPSGFYRFSRRSFLQAGQFVSGLVLASRRGSGTFVRGLEAKSAMRAQGLPIDKRTREFRGYVFEVDDGIATTVSRVHGMTASFNFLSRVNSFENNFWVGYVARTIRESAGTSRVTRLVYEHLGTDVGKVLATARTAGICGIEVLPPFHQRLLQLDDPFR
ncbi:helix-turn-helix transcriptional regulator [Sulfitobacter sp. D35]|uniref:helix-turn-helix domain-containing protein n=1 Tax=Sulfitobacter sp. D35 TaxID=3083252 RepID=UPI00296EBDA9|nr:helix-turn-helix transcriptional regulator [Sulfitobacter sp. D35]MDW4497673.1 helix-turn-helix transcriptional regulator [Sulfitobacter sp. D35]